MISGDSLAEWMACEVGCLLGCFTLIIGAVAGTVGALVVIWISR